MPDRPEHLARWIRRRPADKSGIENRHKYWEEPGNRFRFARLFLKNWLIIGDFLIDTMRLRC